VEVLPKPARCGHVFAEAGCVRKVWVFFINGWNEPTVLSVALLRAALGLRFVIWTDTPNPGQRSVVKRYARSGLLRLLFAKAARVMVTGDLGAALLRDAGCPQEKIVNFPYWVPLPPASLAGCSLDGKRPVGPVRFVAIGRLERIKRFDVAIAALREVIAETGAASARLSIVGEGSERTRLEKQARDAGLADCIDFLGWQEHASTMLVLQKSDALVHPAAWEPYGVAVLEAMAYGKPVIASDMTMAACDRWTKAYSLQIYCRRSFVIHNVLSYLAGRASECSGVCGVLCRVVLHAFEF